MPDNGHSVPLSERAQVALAWLDENTDPRPDGGPSYAVPKRKVYAFALADVFRKRGLWKPGPYGYRGEVNGAANTLVALRRRGLADNDGGGVFIQARWFITEAGRARNAS